MAVIDESLLKTTIAICIKNDEGEYEPIGTGFFVLMPYEKIENRACSFLITNRHVIDGLNEIWMRSYNYVTKIIEYVPINLSKFPTLKSQKADIAAICVSYNSDTQISKHIHLKTNSLCLSDFLSNGGYVGTRCFMLGFPLGLVNEENQFPLYRQGCVSSIFKKENRYLLDIQNFPGNSGSPVFVSLDTTCIKGSKPINEIKLIGVVNECKNYVDQLKSIQTNQIVELRYENSGIANAISVDEIIDLIKEYIKKDEEKRLLEKSNNKTQ